MPPHYPQLKFATELMWNYLIDRPTAKDGARTPSQLTYQVLNLVGHPTVGELIAKKLTWAQTGTEVQIDVDKAIEEVFAFLRNWAGFHFPRTLSALDRILKDVLPRRGISSGDYSTFAQLVQNLFLPASAVALEEYGLPIELTRKLMTRLHLSDDLDEAIQQLKRLDLG